MNKKNIFIKTALAVILTVITLSIISCSNRRIITVEENEFEVRFSLTGANTDNFSAVTATNATYTYAPNDSFTLTATKTNLSSSAYAGNFFRYTATPANVLNITGITTNSITFALTNMEPSSVKITAIVTNNLGQTNGRFTYTINLQKADYPTPPIIYVTTNQVGINGAVLTYGVQTGSDKRSTYQNTTELSNISGSATAGISADGTVTVTNGISGTSVFEVRLTSPNYVDYVVRITGVVDTAIRLKEIITGGIIPADLGSEADPLVKDILGHLGANVGASIKVLYVTESGSGDNSGTDWNNAINGNNLRNTIVNISDASTAKPYLVLVGGGTYKPTTGADRSLFFTMKNFTAIIGGFDARGNRDLVSTTAFSGDIGTINSTNDNTYQVFSHNNIPLNNAVLYGVTITGGNASGTVPLNYGGGMYNTGSSPRLFNVVFSNNIANALGGGMFNDSSSPVLTGVEFSGNSATVSGGGMYNNNSSLQLFNVVFSSNNSRDGGGMYSEKSSAPMLTGVEFTGNSATQNGGGMYNILSTPVLTGVEFTGNSATQNGGGMYNNFSTPMLAGVEFTGNSAAYGGGVHNRTTSPVLTSVVFSFNTARTTGGGMYNVASSPVLMGAVFAGNRATDGGAMYNDNDAKLGPLIVNTIFAGNTASGIGQDIAMRLDTSAGETIRIAGSVLGIGMNNHPTNAIVGVDNTNRSINLTYHSLANGAVNFGPNATLGGLTYPTILGTSSAKDLGLYMRRDSATNYYFSENTTAWYTNFTATGGFGTAVALPAGAEDLTARDIAGNARVGRPDAGVYEYRP